MTDRFDTVGKLSLKRVLALFLLMAVIFFLFSVRLFEVQIVHGDDYAALADASQKRSVALSASRGEILDRNQTALVSNRTSYAVTLDYNFFPHGSGEEVQQAQNDCLLALVRLLSEQNEEWNDALPISDAAPYTFAEDREAGVTRLKNYLRMAKYATAANCMDQMVTQMGLEGYSEADRRCLAGIRYGMQVAGFGVSAPYTFANDISDTTMYQILENSERFPGVDVVTVPVREYVGGEVGCHIIGTVGPIYAEEYAQLKEKGYSFNDIVGKSGIESAAEDALRGKAGKRVLVKNSSGIVVSETETVAPTPGDTLILNLDSNLQKVAQDTLDQKIRSLRSSAASLKGRDVKSGSVVMLDVKTGGVMVCASWPGYDLSAYTENYNELVENKDNPLFNRALYGAFPCGSTFKPGMALAAITEQNAGLVRSVAYRYRDRIANGGSIDYAVINCTHKYMYYAPSYTPNCMGTHGNLNAATAIQKSCNYYFYEVGRLMGSSIFSYLTAYGFGQKTGVEIGETAGIQQTPEYLQSIGDSWVPGDYLQLAIGQRGSYTPIQLAAYTMMIANKGVRYKTHFISAYRQYGADADTVVKPEVAATVKWSDEAMRAVKQGMVAVGKAGTASAYFAATPYTVACKTGTAQTGIKNASDHGTFIAYAPADDPQVAIAVVMERGTSGSASYVARQVLDAYFSIKEVADAPTESNVLLP